LSLIHYSTALRDQWIREGEGFILVYSITARSTFERIERFWTQIARVKDSETVPIVLVGNKVDRANEREVGREEGAALAKRLGCDFVEASAKTRVNLEDPYFTLVRKSTLFLSYLFPYLHPFFLITESALHRE
jgi:GTPase KRas protein